MIRIVMDEVSTDSIDHTLRYLSSRRSIEEGRRMVTSPASEGRELTADFVDVIVQ